MVTEAIFTRDYFILVVQTKSRVVLDSILTNELSVSFSSDLLTSEALLSRATDSFSKQFVLSYANQPIQSPSATGCFFFFFNP